MISAEERRLRRMVEHLSEALADIAADYVGPPLSAEAYRKMAVSGLQSCWRTYGDPGPMPEREDDDDAPG